MKSEDPQKPEAQHSHVEFPSMKVRVANDLSSISFVDLIFTTLLAAGIALTLKLFVLGVFEIPSSSMERTLIPGDFILVSKLAYKIDSVEAGDIVVFERPEAIRVGEPGSEQDALIKRVIGLPGDTVKLTSNIVYINGLAMPNPPLGSTTQLLPDNVLDTKGNSERTIVVPSHHYFVLGDNRANSYDSRFWGCLPDTSIMGAPLFVYWSFGATLDDTSAHIRWERILESIR